MFTKFLIFSPFIAENLNAIDQLVAHLGKTPRYSQTCIKRSPLGQ